MKLKKMTRFLIDNIRHDFGFYNPIWKWKDLPKPLNESYDLLYPKLLEWQKKEYIELLEIDGEKIIKILKVPEEE